MAHRPSMSAYIRECPGIDPSFRQRGQRLSVGHTAPRGYRPAAPHRAAGFLLERPEGTPRRSGGVGPCGRTGSGDRLDPPAGALFLEAAGAEMAKCRMTAPLLVAADQAQRPSLHQLPSRLLRTGGSSFFEPPRGDPMQSGSTLEFAGSAGSIPDSSPSSSAPRGCVPAWRVPGPPGAGPSRGAPARSGWRAP